MILTIDLDLNFSFCDPSIDQRVHVSVYYQSSAWAGMGFKTRGWSSKHLQLQKENPHPFNWLELEEK